MTDAEKEHEARLRVEAEAKAAMADPESVPNFVIAPTRYYLGQWFIELPQPLCAYGAKKGDLSVMVYRKLDTLTDWFVKLRFRYYLGPNPDDPFSADDKKKFTMYALHGRTEEQWPDEMEKLFASMVAGAGLLMGEELIVDQPDFLELRMVGGDALMEKMMNSAVGRKWMHFKPVDELEKMRFFTKLKGDQ